MNLSRFVVKTAMAIEQILATNAFREVRLETVAPIAPGEEKSYSLVRPDGTLVSLINIRGTGQFFEKEEFEIFMNRLHDVLAPFLADDGVKLQFFYLFDPVDTKQAIEETIGDVRETIKRLDLDLEWLYEKKIDRLSKTVIVENIYLAFETNYRGLSQGAIEKAQQELRQNLSSEPYARKAMRMLRPASVLFDKHHTGLVTLVQNLQTIGIMCDVLEAHDAIRDVRRILLKEQTDESWMPRTPLSVSPEKNFRAPTLDSEYDGAANLLYQRLSDQMFPAPITISDKDPDRIVRIGDRFYAAAAMVMPPLSPQKIHQLVRLANTVKTPFALSIRLDGKSTVKEMAFKRTLAAFLAFSSIKTKMFKNAYDYAKSIVLSGEDVTGVSFSTMTWADDEQEVRARIQSVVRIMQSWAQMEVTDYVGFPAQGVFTTLPMVSNRDFSERAIAPTKEILPMLPVSRVASPWRHGSLLFRTKDGTIYPYEPFSALQASWSILGFAQPGQGKSVLISAYVLSLVTASGQYELPYVGIIDVGVSSKGLIDLLKASISPQKRHLVDYIQLQNTIDYAINPFDTLLGWDKPIPMHRDALIDFLCGITTPEKEKAPPAGLSSVVTEAIDIAYQTYSRKEFPKRFDPTLDPEITALVKEIAIPIDEKTSWWEITDALFERGQIEAAAKAQRYAVPTLSDISVIVGTDHRILNKFTGRVLETGQPITEFAAEQFRDTLNRYPILSRYTRFSISDTRVVALDLAAVAPVGSAAAAKQSGIMYSLARHVIVSRYYLTKDLLNHIDTVPKLYHGYYERLILKNESIHKTIIYDEFHRTDGAGGIRMQIERDIREGRKFGIQTVMFSQRVHDFPESSADLATTIFVLGVRASKDQAEILKKRFQMSDTALEAVQNFPPPGPRGAPLYMKTQVQVYGSPTCELLGFNTLCAHEIWAYATDSIDRAVRSIVYNALGVREGLEALVMKLPEGTAKKEFERRKFSLSSSEDGSEITNENTLTEAIAHDVIENYRKFKRMTQQHQLG